MQHCFTPTILSTLRFTQLFHSPQEQNLYISFAFSFKNNILENAYEDFPLPESITEFHFLKGS